MFRLHDRTRRWICTVGFFLLCVAPTLLLLAWAVAWRMPGHVLAEARALGQQLGLNVTLSGLRHPRPGVVLYEGVELANRETGQTVLRCRLVEAVSKSATDEQGGKRSVVVLTASQPEIDLAEWDEVRELVARLLARRIGTTTTDLKLLASEATLRAGQTAQTFTEVQGVIQSLPKGTQMEWAFRLAGVETPEPARICIRRSTETNPPSTRFEWFTGGGAMPCRLLDLGLDEPAPLGNRSRFRGHFWAERTPEGWQGEITGQLSEVDLDRLVSDYFPHKLSGLAQLTFRRVRFAHGRIEEADVSLAAGPGVISRSLLDAASKQLGLVQGHAPQGNVWLAPYEKLAVSVAIDAEGLRLRGECPGDRARAVVVDDRGPLLGEPSCERQPVTRLLRMLVPDNALQVPATRQTDWLARWLPLAEVVPSRGDAPAPRAPVRLGRKESAK